MYEVFNVRTGETIGYCFTEAWACIRIKVLSNRGIWADYINADESDSGF